MSSFIADRCGALKYLSVLVLLMLGSCAKTTTRDNLRALEFSPLKIDSTKFDEAEYRIAFDEAADLYHMGDFERARSFFTKLSRMTKIPAEAASSIYRAGRCCLALGLGANARSNFERALEIVENKNSPTLVAYSTLGLADTALMQGRPAETLDILQRLRASRLATKLATSELTFKKGVALEALDRIPEAVRAYHLVGRSWPLSFAAKEAKGRIRTLASMNEGVSGISQSMNTARRASYRVFAGLFSNRSSAEAMARKLAAHGFHARIEATQYSRGGRFEVMLGRFVVRTDAERLAKIAKKDGFKVKVLP